MPWPRIPLLLADSEQWAFMAFFRASGSRKVSRAAPTCRIQKTLSPINLSLISSRLSKAKDHNLIWSAKTQCKYWLRPIVVQRRKQKRYEWQRKVTRMALLEDGRHSVLIHESAVRIAEHSKKRSFVKRSTLCPFL